MLPIGLLQRYINVTLNILDIINPSVLYLKHNVSKTGFCLRLHVEPIEWDPIDKLGLHLRRQLALFTGPN
jgi:hypothetical protein